PHARRVRCRRQDRRIAPGSPRRQQACCRFVTRRGHRPHHRRHRSRLASEDHSMSTNSTLAQVIETSQHRGAFSRLSSHQTFWVFIAAVAACLALSLLTDTFATERNLFNVARNFAFVGIIAVGMTAVIASGGIDLSVGSTVVLSAMTVAVLMESGQPIWVGIPVALGAAVLVGLVNGILIAYGGMPAVVVTLGMRSV